MGLASCICLLLTFFTYVRSDIVLTQPASETKKPGESLKLSCSVSGFSLDSYYVHWVKQVTGKGLEWLLAYRRPSDSIYYAPGVEGRIVPSRDSTTTYITINSLKADDTAMYYCAKDSQRPNQVLGSYRNRTGTIAATPIES